MLDVDFTVDIHCHPNLKPLGKSFKFNPYQQSLDPDNETSLWNYDPPSTLDKLLNELTLTKFSQSNLTAAYYGRIWVMGVALGSIEKWFFKNGLDPSLLGNLADNFAVGLSLAGIKAIEQTTDYFSDLNNEIKFLNHLNGREVLIDGIKCRYQIFNNFSELEALIESNKAAIEDANENGGTTELPITIALMLSIEGLHTLNCGLGESCDPKRVKDNAFAIKRLEHRIFFVTFCHHFFNELCGHAKSLNGLVADTCDQQVGINTGFTDLGKEIIDILLDDAAGKRIFIDIKHFSSLGREQYFEIRKRKDPENTLIPVIISHGACNGWQDAHHTWVERQKLASTFCPDDINFFDNEIVEVVQSGGIFGLQLDERRVANKETLKATKNSIFRNKIMHYRSELIWNQIQYIAELLDGQSLPAWEHVAIGSDYDGIVDPINGFWTIEHYEALKSNLERHAHTYLQENRTKFKLAVNQNISASDIVNNVFQLNAWRFFKKWF